MNHAGEIEPLSRLVRPEVAIITAIAPAHLEFFSSTAEIAKAKAEIFLGIVPGGAAILPRDSQHFGELRDYALTADIGRILSFGNHIESSARLLHAAVGSTDTVVSALLGDRSLGYRLGLSGRQWASNSLAVLLAAEVVGVAPESAVVPLAHMAPPKGRGSRRLLPWQGGGIEIIDESYNASPAAMAAAIATLAAARPAAGGRRIAVLGDMLELGDSSPELHAGLARIIDEWRIDLVFTAGPLMRHLHDALAAPRRGGHAAGSDGSADQLRAIMRPGDVVMVKGSAGSRMGHVVRDLEQAAAFTTPAPVPTPMTTAAV
jgi:UDP-N-acetylmuramoyl-tripeptide--D-alanyl-D-alanine ligase